MSREERRAYQRQMRGMDRGPSLPPAARARAERNAAKRAQRVEPKQAAEFSRSFWMRSILIAIAAGFVGFSLQWGSGMPTALYVGLAVGAAALLILVGVRYLQRRLAAT
jgi:hypothetical protein